MKPLPFMIWPQGGLGRFIAANPHAEFLAKAGIFFLALFLVLQFIADIKIKRILQKRPFLQKSSCAMLSVAILILFALIIWSILVDIKSM
jgi:hypothetical protein